MTQSPELLNPAQVCRALGITPDSVARLTRGGYLEVKGSVEFKNGIMQLFQSNQVRQLIPQMPQIKRSWHNKDNFRYGASKMARSRVYRQKSSLHNIKLKHRFFEDITQFSDNVKKLLGASYYLYHLNHYAKTECAYLYDIKELVLQTFVREYQHHQELLNISFIEGDNKFSLCPQCKARAAKRRITFVEYLDRFGGCPRCTREYKYYSLYEFKSGYGDYFFCFHTPYTTARKWFDQNNRPPGKQSPQREGAYAFGRTIYDSEAQAVELIEVIEELQKFLSSFGVAALIETRRLDL